jgi:hypothetical protein
VLDRGTGEGNGGSMNSYDVVGVMEDHDPEASVYVQGVDGQGIFVAKVEDVEINRLGQESEPPDLEGFDLYVKEADVLD